MRRDESIQSLWALEMALAQKREEWAYMNQQPKMLPVINEPIYTKEDDDAYPLPKHIEMRRNTSFNLRVTRSDDFIY